MKQPVIELISIGDELLKGATLNTNAHFLGGEISNAGWQVGLMTTVSDEASALQACIKQASQRAEIVIATGGLGPTLDDQTLKHADQILPGNKQELPNSVGTASGWIYKDAGVILLPGVPAEMKAMWKQILPFIEERLKNVEKVHSRDVVFALLPELAIDPILRELQKECPGVQFGIYPSYGTVTVTLRGPNAEILDAPIAKLAEAFPTNIMAYHRTDTEEVLHQLLIERKSTLALAESCTGGAVASRITALPNSSGYFLGSAVTYSNAVKMHLLKVSSSTLESEGAVSEATAREMLDGVFAQFSCDYGIAITGVAGPSGGTEQKPVGTVWVAVGKRGTRPYVGRVPWFKPSHGRHVIIQGTATYVLNVLWRYIQHDTFPEDGNG